MTICFSSFISVSPLSLRRRRCHYHKTNSGFRLRPTFSRRCPLLLLHYQSSKSSSPISNNYNDLSTTGSFSHSSIPIPSDNRNPLLGVFVDLFSHKFVSALQSFRFGRVYKSNVLLRDVIVISDMSLISHIYKDSTMFTTTDAYPNAMVNVFGRDSILFSNGEAHRKQRNVFNLAFAPRLFRSIVPDIVDSAKKMCEQMEKHNSKNNTDCEAIIRAHFLRVIMKFTLRSCMNNGNRPIDIDALLLAFETCASNVIAIPFGPKYEQGKKARMFLNDILADLIKSVISDRAAVIETLRNECSKKSSSFLSSKLLEKHDIDLLTVMISLSDLPTGSSQVENLNEAQQQTLNSLAASIVVLWFAGYFTTSSVFSYCLYELGGLNNDSNPMKSLRTEQKNQDFNFDYDTLTQKLPLLSSFLSEVLRLWPPTPMLHRRVVNTVTVNNYTFKKDAVLYLDMIDAQRNENVFVNPEFFQIDRFLDGRVAEKARQYEGISFGVKGGAHYCVGAALANLSLKIALSMVVQEYDIKVKYDRQKEKRREFIMAPETYPKNGIQITLFRKRAASPRK